MSRNVRLETRIEADVRQALAGTVASICEPQRELLADLAVQTLQHDLGALTVQRVDGEAVTGIEAWFEGGGCMVLAVEAGELLTDQADATGVCGTRQTQLEEGLTRRGVRVRRTAEDDHGSATGPLVAAAQQAARPGGGLATAVAGMSGWSAAARSRRAVRSANRPRQQASS